MKEKRYFCDWGSRRSIKGIESVTFILLGYLIVLIAISIIFGFIHDHIMTRNQSEDDLEANFESAYEYLDEIADNVIGKDGINVGAIPKDVAEYEITYKDDKIIFKYSLDNNIEYGIFSSFSPSMTITLSKDFEVLSKKPDYSSKEEFVKYHKIAVCAFSAAYGLIIWFTTLFAYIITMLVTNAISKKHKERDMKNLS